MWRVNSMAKIKFKGKPTTSKKLMSKEDYDELQEYKRKKMAYGYPMDRRRKGRPARTEAELHQNVVTEEMHRRHKGVTGMSMHGQSQQIRDLKRYYKAEAEKELRKEKYLKRRKEAKKKKGGGKIGSSIKTYSSGGYVEGK
tara:strand:+ start:1715 stop:2137 length:423 start_codon:yes stop_codon:yes gene_type:complete